MTNGYRKRLILTEIKITSKSNFLVTKVINKYYCFLDGINYIIKSRADNPMFEIHTPKDRKLIYRFL